MLVSAAITVIGVTLLPPNAWPPIIMYIIIGALIPLAMRIYRRRVDAEWTPRVLTPADIGKVD